MVSPPEPNPARFFYGWWIVLGAAVGQFSAVAFASVLFSIVLTPMTSELGWSRTEFVFATSAAGVLASIAGPVIGPLIDRHGARPLMFVGAVSYGLILLAISRITEHWQFFALQALAGLLARPLIAGVVVNVTIAKWFVVQRAWAISIASSGFSIGTMLMPPAATALVAGVGWRDSFVAMAVLFWLLMIPASMLMRSNPEAYGLEPDGYRETSEPDERARVNRLLIRADMERSFTRHEAVRTTAFWLLLIAFALFLAGNFAVLIHAIPYAVGSGFGTREVGFAFGLTGVTGLASKFVWGWALSRYQPRHLSAGAFGLAMAGASLTVVANETGALSTLALGFALWGAGFGGVTPLSEYMWATYFGRAHLGAIRGLGVPAQVAGTALGPLVVAVWVDVTASYFGAFILIGAIYVVGAGTILASRAPGPRGMTPVG